MSGNNAGRNYLNTAFAILAVALVTSSAFAGMAFYQPELTSAESGDPLAPPEVPEIQADEPDPSLWKMSADTKVTGYKIATKTSSKNTPIDCYCTANGLLFCLYNPYIGETAETVRPYGLEDVGSYNYTVDYSSGTQEIVFTDNENVNGLAYTDYRDHGDDYHHIMSESAETVPLAWLCGYDKGRNTVGGSVMNIPAVVEINGKEYYVYGTLDGNDVWSGRSFFAGTSKLLMSAVNIFVAYDHYQIPPALFQGNTNVRDCTIKYLSYDIDWETEEFHSEGYIFYIGDLAFKGTSIQNLELPSRIDCMGYNCFSQIGVQYFVFDCSVHSFQSAPKPKPLSGYCFSGMANLKYLYIGKNVDNLPDNLFSGLVKTDYPNYEVTTSYSNRLVIVYNAGTKVTQSAIEKAVESSNSANNRPVFLFNLCGGDLEKDDSPESTLPGYSSAVYNSTAKTITMPVAYVQTGDSKTYIPAWRINNEAEKVVTGSVADVRAYTKGIVTFYGTCSVTYHFEDRVIGTQDLVCEYASFIYGASDFGTTFSRFELSGWNTAENGSGTDHAAGETVVSIRDLDLYAQGSYKTINVTYHYTSGSVVSEAVMTYSDERGLHFPYADDLEPAADSFDFWCSAPAVGEGCKLYRAGDIMCLGKDSDLYAVSVTEPAFRLEYRDGEEASFENYSSDGIFTVQANTVFSREGYEFLSWQDAYGNTYHPGDSIVFESGTTEMVLYAAWAEIETEGILTYHDAGKVYEQIIEFRTPVDLIIPPGWSNPGHRLVGWATTENAQYITYLPSMSVNTSANLDLYAVWTDCDVTIVVVPVNTLIAYDGEEHDLLNGFSVFGLPEDYTITMSASLLDEDGNVVGAALPVCDVGVYHFLPVCTVTYNGAPVDQTQVSIFSAIGTFVIVNNGPYASITLGN